MLHGLKAGKSALEQSVDVKMSKINHGLFPENFDFVAADLLKHATI